jgi:hypothetical protein
VGYWQVRPVDRFELLPPVTQLTVRAVLASGRDQAARDLGVHVSTVSTSMSRACRALGLEGGRADRREALQQAVTDADDRAHAAEILDDVTHALYGLAQAVRAVQDAGGAIDNPLLQRLLTVRLAEARLQLEHAGHDPVRHRRQQRQQRGMA